MMTKQAYIGLANIPDGWSEEAADFFNKLLIRKPENRLGFRGANEVKEHPWIKYYPWNLLYEKKIDSPFIPDKRDNFDKKYCESTEKIGLETKMRYEQYRNDNEFINLFVNFTYYGIIEENFREIISTDENEKLKVKKNLVYKSTTPTNVNSRTKSISNNTLNTSNSNHPTTAKTTNRLHRTTSSIIKVKKHPPKLINSSYSSINLFNFSHNKPKTATNKGFSQKPIHRSYVNNAILSKSIHSELTKSTKSLLGKSPVHSLSRSPIQRKKINISYLKPSTRSPSPINKMTSRSVSPSNISLLSSYAEKNKKKIWDNSTSSHKSPRRSNANNNSNLTSNLLKQIRMNSSMMKNKKGSNICLRRSNSNYGNIMSKNIIDTPLSMKNNSLGMNPKSSNRRNSSDREDRNNVNVNVVVINNGIINLNDSNNVCCVNGEQSKRKDSKKRSVNVNGKGFWGMHKKLNQSNSIKYLFQNYQISPVSNNNGNYKYVQKK